MDLQIQQSSAERPRHVNANNFSSGREFYDDGYTEEEQNFNDLPSTFLAATSISASASGQHSYTGTDVGETVVALQDPSTSNGGVAPWRQSSCFLGREAELRQLKDLKEQVIGQDTTSCGSVSKESAERPASKRVDTYPAVLVWGVSGTGKSTLIDHFLRTCCICNTRPGQPKEKDGTQQRSPPATTKPTSESSPSCSCCYILRGKYDEYTGQSDPFSAIVHAIQDFVSQLKRGPKEELHRIRECVRVAFPTGGFRPLVKVVPSLSILSPTRTVRRETSMTLRSGSRGDNRFGDSIAESKEDTIGESSLPISGGVLTEKTWNQLRYVFVQFIKAISTKKRPIYMFLDDLQWSASIGLSLLAKLVDDTGLKNFLLLGAIRQEANPHCDEPVDLSPDHPLAQCFVTPLSPGEDEGEDGNRNEADGASATTATTPMSQAGAHRHPRSLRQIKITNLSQHDMTAWLSTMLQCDDVEILARKLHAKTHGNIFFTLQALEDLERKNFLVFSRISFQWEWNLQKRRRKTKHVDQRDDKSIASSTQLPISNNLTGIIESKLCELPKQLQQVLSIAAYIRSMFDISVLLRVLKNECKHVDGEVAEMGGISTTQELSDMLEAAVLERLISNTIGGTRYHFVHDSIQQAAYGLIPFGEAREKLRVRIGRCLLKMCRSMRLRFQHQHENGRAHGSNASDGIPHQGKDEDKNAICSQSTHSTTSTETSVSAFSDFDVDDGLLFVAADHLNSVQTKDHVFSATMNLEVGQRASEIAALESAAVYLQKAHAALRRVRIARKASPSNSSKSLGGANGQGASSSIWDSDEHYVMCLQVHRARADIELSLSRYQVGYELCNQILERARSLDDKIPTYYSMARALGRDDRQTEALDLDVTVLRTLDEFPKGWYSLHIAKSMLKIKSFLRTNTNEDILAMPLLSDPRKMFAMKIAADLNTRLQVTNNRIMLILNLCRMLRATIKYGISGESALAFTTYGLAVAAMGDQPMAERCRHLADAILVKTGAKQFEGHVHLLKGMYIMPFSASFPELLQMFRKGYLESMEAGEFDIGLMNYQACIALGFLHGLELESLLKSADAVLDQLSSYKIQSFIEFIKGFRDMFRLFLREDPVDWAELETALKRKAENKNPDGSQLLENSLFCFGGALVALYHRQYDIAEGMARNYLLMTKTDASYFVIFMDNVIAGLIAAAKYHQTRSRRHLATLRKSIKKARHANKTRGRVWIHQVHLLEAEELSATVKNKRSPKIQHAYNIAIIAATNAGCLHEAALANELAGEHYVRNGERDMVGDYFLHAVDYYKAWGCKTKVADITQRHKKHLKALNRPNRIRPPRLTNDGNGNYLFGITRDALTGGIITRCAGLDRFAERSESNSSVTASTEVPMAGSKFGDDITPDGNFEDDEISVLTDID